MSMPEQPEINSHSRVVSTALESAANSITITDRNGLIIWVNDAFTTLTGYTSQEAIGNTPRILKSGKQDAAFYESLWATILAGMVWHGELINRRKDGSLYFEEVTITPVRDQQGQVTHFIGISQDISERVDQAAERQKLEEQSRQAQKMEAIGRLAGGLAHDFNNLLAVISGYSNLLLRDVEAGALRESVKEIKNAADRAAALTRQLLTFSRRQVLQPRLLDVSDSIANLENALRRLIGEDIELVLALVEPAWPVKIDPNQIEQVIMNLAVNARDAMPRGGKLVIETSNVAAPDFDATTCAPGLNTPTGLCVVVRVTDTGSGFGEAVRSHLFEPFFTARQTGKGTGLGLATVYGIVKHAGGQIWVESEPGKGSTFRVALPRFGERLNLAGWPPTE
jgi:PAS domain S-box-containing protein